MVKLLTGSVSIAEFLYRLLYVNGIDDDIACKITKLADDTKIANTEA